MVVTQDRTRLMTLHVRDRREGVVYTIVVLTVCPSNAVTFNTRVWSPGSKSRKLNKKESGPK